MLNVIANSGSGSSVFLILVYAIYFGIFGVCLVCVVLFIKLAISGIKALDIYIAKNRNL